MALCKGLAKLVVVDIALNRDQDNPQLIFESMNSTGRELSQADLIRNFILMGLEPGSKRLYDNSGDRWRSSFGQEAYEIYFDGFMRHYLDGEDRRNSQSRVTYTKHSSCTPVHLMVPDGRRGSGNGHPRFARYFCAMALGSEAGRRTQDAFHDLRELKVDVALSFLLELYRRLCKPGMLTKSDFCSAVRLVESYVFRRAICAIPTNSMNKTFATFSKPLKKERYLESIQAHFALVAILPTFPADDEFRRDFQIRDLYNFRSRSYWLRRLENHDGRNAWRSTNTPSNTSCRRMKTFPPAGRQNSDRTGNASGKPSCTPSGT